MNKTDLQYLFNQGTDNHFVVKYLIDKEWVNVLEIMTAHGHNERNFAARSRISDINKKIKQYGYEIISRIGQNRQGEYILIESKDKLKYIEEIKQETKEIKFEQAELAI